MRIAGRLMHWVPFVTVLAAACSGGGGGDGNSGGGGGAQTASLVTKLAIQQTGVILTQNGEVKQLTAEATDAAGFVIGIPIKWTSSNTFAVDVDATGKLTARANNGSSQIVAEAAGIKSAPLLAVVTQPAPNAIMLTDDQIVGQPVESAPGAIPSFNNTYEVWLSGVAPPIVGSLLISAESKSVAGRVIAVDSTSSPIKVTLALASIHELLPNLELNETIDLANTDVAIPSDVAAIYDITRTGDTFKFTPKPNVETSIISGVRPLTGAKPLAAATASAIPLFECKSTRPGEVPIKLNVPPIISISIDPIFDLRYSLSKGLERLVVNAKPNVTVEGSLTLTEAFEGKYECKRELFVYPVPIGGALSFLVSGLVPVGVGFEVGGRLTLANIEIGTKVDVKASAMAGIVCGSSSNCEFVRGFSNYEAEVTPKFKTPSIGDVHLEPFLSAFAYLEAQIGNPRLKSLRFDAFEAKAGGKFSGSFATVASQLADEDYQSNYKISLDGSASVGTELGDALKLLGLTSITALELTITTDIAKSPVGNTVVADRPTFFAGDVVNFSVKLDPTTVSFLPAITPYNVNKIQLVRTTGGNHPVVAEASAAPLQTDFNLQFIAPNSGSVTEFSAFVVTSLLQSDLLALEVGKAKPGAGVELTLGVANLTAPYPSNFGVTVRGRGNIVSSPAGINCGESNACTHQFAYADTVSLSAVPDANSIFRGWSGACSGAGACVVKMDRAQQVGAYFAYIWGTPIGFTSQTCSLGGTEFDSLYGENVKIFSLTKAGYASASVNGVVQSHVGVGVSSNRTYDCGDWSPWPDVDTPAGCKRTSASQPQRTNWRSSETVRIPESGIQTDAYGSGIGFSMVFSSPTGVFSIVQTELVIEPLPGSTPNIYYEDFTLGQCN